jgi:hypothetical protein
MSEMRTTAAASALGLILAGALATGSAFAADIVYKVNDPILDGGVVGSITTDGNMGTLTQSDIVSWSLTVYGGGASYLLNPGDSVVFNYGTNGFYGPQSADLTATSTNLYFNYSGSDAGYFGFQSGAEYAGAHYWCNATQNQTFDCATGASAVPVLYSDPTSQYDTSRVGNLVIGSTVPEPAGWAMLILGMGLVGVAKRRRTTPVAA